MHEIYRRAFKNILFSSEDYAIVYLHVFITIQNKIWVRPNTISTFYKLKPINPY